MSKRKPLPYAARALVDQARMANAAARRALLRLMDGQPVTVEERYRLLGLALHELHEGSQALDEIERSTREKVLSD